MRSAIVEKAKAAVVHVYDEGHEPFGYPWNEPALFVHVPVPEELESDNAQLLDVSYDEPEGKWVFEQNATALEEKNERVRDVKLAAVREKRNKMLEEQCDIALREMQWAEIEGKAWPKAKKDKWAAYRQSLLDLPQKIKKDHDDGVADLKDVELDKVVWPTTDEKLDEKVERKTKRVRKKKATKKKPS